MATQAERCTASSRVCVSGGQCHETTHRTESKCAGYFVYNHAGLAGSQDLFAQLWKEYALSDSRYLTSDPFMLCVEAITVVRGTGRTPSGIGITVLTQLLPGCLGASVFCHRNFHRPRQQPAPPLTDHRERSTSLRSGIVLFDVLHQRNIQRTHIQSAGVPVLLGLLRRVQCALGTRSRRYVAEPRGQDCS